jgi:DNA-binding NarL/FixJ family response regulator
VEWHVSNVFGRLGLTSRAQVAVWARKHGVSADE